MKTRWYFRLLRFVPLGILLAACSSPIVMHSPEARPATSYQACPLDSLLRRSPRFIGALVEVQGLFHYSFEQVCLSAPDSPTKGAIYLQFAPTIFRQGRQGAATDSLGLYTGKKVMVRGRFSTASGHLGQYAGTLEDVVFITCEE